MRRHFSLFAVLALLAGAAQAGTVSGKISGAAAGSVVWVDNPSGKTEAPTTPFTMDQKGLIFVPHILIVPVGSTVDFVNSDAVQHNVFWTGIGGNKKLGKNLGTWPQGQKRSFKFDDPGVVTLLCNVHPEMSAYLVVVPTTYYAVTNAAGEFTIENVPDGPHAITVWHEGMKQQTSQINVSGNTKADLELKK